MAVGRDTAGQHQTEQRLRHLATHDVLTELPNRALLEERLREAAQQAEGAGTAFSVGVLDLDGFKRINDSLGHPVGDELLCAVAARLRNLMRRGDTLARTGGDEFVFVLPRVSRAEDLRQVGAMHDAPAPLAPREAHAQLVRALADMDVLAGHVNLGQLIEHAHRLTHQALGPSRSVMLLRNAREHCFAARFAAGEDLESLRALRYSDKESRGLLARLSPGAAIRVLPAPALAAAPEALRTLATGVSQCVLAPVHTPGAVVALFYGDWRGRTENPAPHAETLQLAARLMGALGAAVVRSAQGGPALAQRPAHSGALQ